MIQRHAYLQQIATAVSRSPVTSLLGPRQCGKTTLARMFSQGYDSATFFDLESVPDRQRLQNPELMLSSLKGLVVLDEIQLMPELFGVLRVLADRPLSHSRQRLAAYHQTGLGDPSLAERNSSDSPAST